MKKEASENITKQLVKELSDVAKLSVRISVVAEPYPGGDVNSTKHKFEESEVTARVQTLAEELSRASGLTTIVSDKSVVYPGGDVHQKPELIKEIAKASGKPSSITVTTVADP